MGRIVIDLPENILYAAELMVRVADLNYGGHVGNDSILRLMQEARVLYYRSLGFQDEVSIEGRVGQIITDATVVFKSESFLGDVLVVYLGIDEFNKYGFTLYYRIVNKGNGREVARGKTGILCFDYDRRKVVSIPQKFLEKLNGKQHNNP